METLWQLRKALKSAVEKDLVNQHLAKEQHHREPVATS